MANLAFTRDKNQIATPWHIVEFLSDILDVKNKKVLDPTAGNGAMLEYAAEKYGIELDEKPFKMLCDRYAEGHFINGSLFENEKWIKEISPEVCLMNPPFNADKTKGLEFVRFTADAMGTGMLAAIVPIGCGDNVKKIIVATKEALLKNHTLNSVISFNNELFYPAAAVGVMCLIFELGKPHNGETWFADFSDDGLVKDRRLGRIDKNGTWMQTKEKWIQLFNDRPSYKKMNKEGNTPCNSKEVNAGDFWIPNQNIDFDDEYLRPKPEDFRKTVKDYMDYRIKTVGLEQFLKDNPHLLPPKEERIKQLRKRIAQLEEEIKRLENEDDT